MKTLKYDILKIEASLVIYMFNVSVSNLKLMVQVRKH